MTRTILCLCTILILFHPKEDILGVTNRYIISGAIQVVMNYNLTTMQALDLVKLQYAANFEKVYYENTKEYYYKLPEGNYFLSYEGTGETEQDYLIHLYEYVIDDSDTCIGHAVTYGWFTVNKKNGVITDQTQ